MNPIKNLFQPSEELRLSNHFFKTSLNGLYYFQSSKHNDDRGYFSEIVLMPELEKILDFSFSIKQLNTARSEQNVIRGFHAEGWNKLVTVVSGLALSIIVDVNPKSETYKKVQSFLLGFDHENDCGSGLFISQGLANSICVLEGPVNYLYLVDRLYQDRDSAGDLAISLFDEELDIQWPIEKEQMILSQRDLAAVSLAEAVSRKA